MRAEHVVADLGPRDLALARHELAALVRAAGHELDRGDADALLQLTEGWPVGVSLAVEFLGEHGAAADLRRFGGADRLVASYVRDEILATLPPDRAAFLVRCSVLEILTAPACDALLGRSGSAAILAELTAAGLLVALDRTDERFRHHRLVGAALRAELRRTAPAAETELHDRAGAWHRRTGDIDQRGAPRAARRRRPRRRRPRLGHARRRRRPGPAHGARAPARRLLATSRSRRTRASPWPLPCGELMTGQGHLVQHWVSAAAVARSAERSDGMGVEPALAVLRAVVGEGGPRRMRADAEQAYRAQPEDGPWRSLCSLVAGTAARMLGDARRDRAPRGGRAPGRGVRAARPRPVPRGARRRSPPTATTGRPRRRSSRGRAPRSTGTASRATGRRRSCSRPRPWSARIAGGSTRRASDLQEAIRLQAALTDFAPCHEADVRILVARAALRLSDLGVAHEHLARAARILDRAPEAIGLRRAAEDAQRQLDSFAAAGRAPTASMTAAELRILRYLPTHLSFREIGERTFVSANTVKTQANAVYRKLDVSCRSDAVARARACGLLDG